MIKILKKTGLILALMLAVYAGIKEEKAFAKDSDGDYVILVDPGHGGFDGGASSLNSDYERDINWNIAQSLKSELQTYEGVKVYLTRGSGEPFSNTGRARLGKELGADYCISIHNNSGSSGVSGAICFGSVNTKTQESSKAMALSIVSQLEKYVGFGAAGGYLARENDYYEEGSKSDYYTFIDEAAKCGIPAVIVEHCYLSNESDSSFIHDVTNQYLMGKADATGIAQKLGLTKRTVSDGGKVNLIRSYSVQFNSTVGTFSSSDEKVAVVSSEGIITAVGPGTATIKCTGNAGIKSVTVNVPSVKQVALGAGVMNTMNRSYDDAIQAKNGPVMVKAVYSDGFVQQVQDASVGEAQVGKTVDYIFYDGSGVNQMTEIDVPVMYNGFSTKLRLYYGSRLDLGSYNAGNSSPVSDNENAIILPESFKKISITPGEAAAREGAAVSTSNAGTDLKNQNMPAADQSKNANVSSTDKQQSTQTNNNSGSTQQSDKQGKSIARAIIIIFIVIAALGILVFVILFTIAFIRDRNRRKRRRRRKSARRR